MNNNLNQIPDKYNVELAENSIIETLTRLVERHRGKVVFTTSFGYEDQVITDLIFRNELDIKVVWDTVGSALPALSRQLPGLLRAAGEFGAE